MSEFIKDLESSIKSVTKEWKKEKLHEEKVSRQRLNRIRYRPPSISAKEAGFKVMEEAYNIASSNGKYYANARPKIMEITGKRQPWRDDNYFTQNILKEYLEEYNPPWKITYYEKGSLHEPHTNKSIGIGGIAVKSYLYRWKKSEKDGISLLDLIEEDKEEDISQIKTIGPTNRFQGVLFIEKEGFNEILKDAGIAEKYDIAIMSTKGMPTGACSQLLQEFNVEDDFKIFALHDFDKDGIKILNTLREGTRLHKKDIDVIDLGLRLEDVQKYDLPGESVGYPQEKNPKYMLSNYGVTDEEADFLVRGRYGRYWEGQRVELNAMMSEQLVNWIDEKLSSYLDEKYIPSEEVLKEAYKRAILNQKVRDFAEKLYKKTNKGDSITIPDDLEKQVKDSLQLEDERSWDDIVWEIAKTNKEEK